MFELGVAIIVTLVVIAFLCEYVDSTLGMGYGTTLTPVLLLMGFGPLQIVPAVLLSELVSGILAGVLHHREGNVNFALNNAEMFRISKILEPLGYVDAVRKAMPLHLKIALLLAACSMAGTVIAVFVAVSIPRVYLKLYIGCLVLSMGIVMLIFRNRRFAFSRKRIALLGVVASFNKGMSGGGYGPVVTSGQILSGVDGKSAIGITSLAEGLTCLVGVITYMIVCDSAIDWKLAPYVVAGAVLSVPLCAKSVKLISTNKLKLAITVLTMVLGTFTIVKTLS